MVLGTSDPFVVTSATHFGINMPASVSAGTPFNLTLSALNGAGLIDTLYQGTVQITSTDPTATVLGTYTFTAADHGKQIITGLVLHTDGRVRITVTDTSDPLLKSVRGVTVTAATAGRRHHAAAELLPDAEDLASAEARRRFF